MDASEDIGRLGAAPDPILATVTCPAAGCTHGCARSDVEAIIAATSAAPIRPMLHRAGRGRAILNADRTRATMFGFAEHAAEVTEPNGRGMNPGQRAVPKLKADDDAYRHASRPCERMNSAGDDATHPSGYSRILCKVKPVAKMASVAKSLVPGGSRCVRRAGDRAGRTERVPWTPRPRRFAPRPGWHAGDLSGCQARSDTTSVFT